MSSSVPKKSRSKTTTTTPKQIAAWQGRIKSGWQKSVRGIVENAKTIRKIHEQAKKVHGSWSKVFEGPGKPGFGIRTAGMLIKIAEHKVLTNAKYTSHLPPCWYSMYRLTHLSADRLIARIADKKVHADMQQADVETVLRLEDSRAREASRIGAEDKRYKPKHLSAETGLFPSRSSSKAVTRDKPDPHDVYRQLQGVVRDFQKCQDEIRANSALQHKFIKLGDIIIAGAESAPPPVKSARVKSAGPQTAVVH